MSTEALAIDPFSTVVRFALLPYMERGVKVGIVNNAITFFRPTVIDTVRRTVRSWMSEGCSKHSLYALRVPFGRAVRWYYGMAPELFEMARTGIERLRSNYSDSNATAALDMVVDILDNPEEGDDDPETPMLQRLRHMWGQEDIDVIVRQLRRLPRAGNPLYECETIDRTVQGKNAEVQAVIRGAVMQ